MRTPGEQIRYTMRHIVYGPKAAQGGWHAHGSQYVIEYQWKQLESKARGETARARRQAGVYSGTDGARVRATEAMRTGAKR